MTASSRKVFEISFSSAHVRLLPSIRDHQHCSVSEAVTLAVPMIRARSSSSPVLRWFLIAASRLLMNSYVSCCESSLMMTYITRREREPGPRRLRPAHQVHGLGNKPARHADVDRRFLPVSGENPYLSISVISIRDKARSIFCIYIP